MVLFHSFAAIAMGMVCLFCGEIFGLKASGSATPLTFVFLYIGLLGGWVYHVLKAQDERLKRQEERLRRLEELDRESTCLPIDVSPQQTRERQEGIKRIR